MSRLTNKRKIEVELKSQVSSVQPFTGNLCNYPELLEVIVGMSGVSFNSQGQLIGFDEENLSHTMALYNFWTSLLFQYDPPMNEGEITAVSYLFPIFATTSYATIEVEGWGPTLDETSNNYVNLYHYYNYFVAQDGLGDSTNIGEYGYLVSQSGYWEGYISGMSQTCLISWLMYVRDAGIVTECMVEPTVDYDVAFPYTGNPCDYPAITDMQNMVISEESAFQDEETWNSILIEYGPVGATHFLPDFNMDGVISTADLLVLLPLLYEGPHECITEEGGISTYDTLTEGLYTRGGQLVYKNGKKYVGHYHYHPEIGFMVGKNHTDSHHEVLIPIALTKNRNNGTRINRRNNRYRG
jgi:hypothetical protein